MPHGTLTVAMTYVSHFFVILILLHDCMLRVWKYNSSNVQLESTQVKKNTSQAIQLHKTQGCYLTMSSWSNVPTYVLFLVFWPFMFLDKQNYSGAGRHKKSLLTHCWFKVLARQILGRELRAESWPFCSLLSSANFFPGTFRVNQRATRMLTPVF